jgi:replicative DNA helicase
VTDYEMKTRGNLVSSFNTSDDDCDDIIREIRKKYSKANVVTSGIPDLDTGFLNGGYQPSRLYLYAGTSGVGKSLMLLNQATRAAMSKRPIGFLPGVPGLESPPEEVYLYITMENYAYETWTRLYCSMFNQTKEQMLSRIGQTGTTYQEFSQEMRSILQPFNSSLQVEYFPAHSISPASIASLIKKYNKDPERRIVKAVYVDYLDLLQSDNPREHYRLELGEITSSLKTIAGSMEIPIITATQLNREAYKRGKNGELGSDMMSESIQKLFIADFSVIMTREDAGKKKADDQPEDRPKKVILKIDKNRDGRTGTTHIYFDYARSRFMTQDEVVEAYQETLTV